MRLAVLTNYDAAAALALHQLLPALGQHQVQVFYTDKPHKATTALSALAEFDRAQAASTSVFESTNAELLNDINGHDFARWKNYNPALAISIRHMSILQPDAIAVADHGILNLHSGHLPDYQGVMATFWAMLNGEPELGTTLHYIEDASIDTGAVVAQSSTQTRFDKSYFWNTLNLYRQGCANILSAVNTLERGLPTPRQPQHQGGQYFTFPTDTDLMAFNYPLFDPEDSVNEFFD